MADSDRRIVYLDRNIAKLQKEIRSYAKLLNQATTRNEMNLCAGLINCGSENLNQLVKERTILSSATTAVRDYPCTLTFHEEVIIRNVANENEIGLVTENVGKMLVLDEIPDVFGERNGTCQRIYIRKCYEELYDLVTATMIQECTRVPAILFTGVPGIGKSMFMIYLLCRFQTDRRFVNKSFAFEVDHGAYYYFKSTSPVVRKGRITTAEFNCSGLVSRNEVPVEDILVVVDICEFRQPQCRAKWTLIFSAPNPYRYKEFMKNEPRYTFIVPTWSQHELWCVNENTQQWYQRFVVCGGVPRLIFWNQFDDDPIGAIYGVLTEKGAMVAEYFFKNKFGGVDSEKSYSLVHFNPPYLPEEDRVQYHCHIAQVVYTFASDHIFQRLASIYFKGLVCDAANLFNTGGGLALQKLGPVSAGHLFEKICLWLVPLAGKNISILPLPLQPQHPQTRTRILVGLPPMKELAYNWKESRNLRIGVLYQPLISNLESGDAFCVIKLGTELILIVVQIIVDQKHPIKANGLKSIFQAYPLNIRNRIRNKLIVFVTPYGSELSIVQPIHTQGNEVMAEADIPMEARNYEQYVYQHFIKI